MATTNRNQIQIFVGGLSSGTSESDLSNYFSKFGQVIQAKLAKLSKVKKSKGYAFVTIDSQLLDDELFSQHHIINDRKVDCQLSFKGKKKPVGHEDEQRRKKLYVSGFPLDFSNEEFEALFAPYGKIKFGYLIKDGKTSHNKDFGYIEFFTQEDADLVLKSSIEFKAKSNVLTVSPFLGKSDQRKVKKDQTFISSTKKHHGVSPHSRGDLESEKIKNNKVSFKKKIIGNFRNSNKLAGKKTLVIPNSCTFSEIGANLSDSLSQNNKDLYGSPSGFTRDPMPGFAPSVNRNRIDDGIKYHFVESIVNRPRFKNWLEVISNHDQSNIRLNLPNGF